MSETDTIIAIASPQGRSSRGVIRLSGPEAVPCAAARFRPAGPVAQDTWQRGFRATPGELMLLGEGLGVPAVLYVMRAPRSYTREDVVEFHLPGSLALLEMALEDVLASGAGAVRLAGPGEFTRRAFLSGRIDLTQAEAVLSVIRARSESELLAAASRLRGGAGRFCSEVQDALTGLRVHVEAALDFAQHGIGVITEADLLRRCAELRSTLQRKAARGRGELASDGSVHVVICGPPNAGKSSLLNRLAGEQKAIVHDRAGTTRDAVRAEIELGGVFFRVTDTAGIAPDAAGADAEAVRRARDQVSACQLTVLVLDGSAPLPPGATDVASPAPRERVVCAINKCDLPQVLDEALLTADPFAWETVHTSALTGEGLDELREALGRTVTEGRLDASAADCLFNVRQRDALRRAAVELDHAGQAAGEGLGYEFAAVNLREAADALAEVTGQVTAQDVLDRVFSQFCIGK